MGLAVQLGRTLYNVLLLRGRRRRAKLFLLVVLSMVFCVLVMRGRCLVDSRLCKEDSEHGLQHTRDMFENAGDYQVNLNPGPHRSIKVGPHSQNLAGGQSPGGGAQPDPQGTLEEQGSKQETQIPRPPQEDGFQADMKEQNKKQETKVSTSPEEMALQEGGREAQRQSTGGVDPQGHVQMGQNSVAKEKSQDTTGQSQVQSKLSSGPSEMNNPSQTGPYSEQIGRSSEAHSSAPSKATALSIPSKAPSGSDEQQSAQQQPAALPAKPFRTTTDEVKDSISNTPSVLHRSKSLRPDPTAGVTDSPQVLQVEKDGMRTEGNVGEYTTSLTGAPKDAAVQTGLDVGNQGRGYRPEQKEKAAASETAPSSPPGVVALPKQRRMVGDKQGESNAVEQPGVRMIAKEKYGVKGEEMGGGGGGAADGQEEEGRMSASEMARAIQAGEMCKTVCPPFVWSEWSPCSKACGRGRRYRKAMYQIICRSSAACPLNRIEESVCEIPCKFDPEKYGGPTGLDMYPINPLNPAMYPEDRKYMCGHWLVEYEKLHSDIISGRRPPSYLVYSTGKGTYPTAGGISARIRGITSVFLLAVLLDRAFMIEWLDPPGLEEYLEPKSFNWANLTPIQKLQRGPARDIGSWRSAKESGKSSQWYMTTNFSTFFTNELEVVQGHRYDFTYAILRNPELMPKAYELGVDRIKCRICCAFHMLFRMTERFQKQMDELLSSLGAPRREIGTIQLRTKSSNVQDAVKSADAFLKCGTKAGKSLKMTSRISWVPIFNNRLVVHIVQKKYGDKLKTPINIDSATRTVHTHLGNLPADTELEVAKAVQERTFKEFFLMINSTIIIRKKGYEASFGNIADAIRRFYHELGTVHTYLVGSTCSKFPDTYKIE